MLYGFGLVIDGILGTSGLFWIWDATANAMLCARKIGAVMDRDNGPACSCAVKGTFADLASVDSELSVKKTRFGPNWPGARCGARTKAGGDCQRLAVKRTGRCTRRGGKSTAPSTQAGRHKIAALHTILGRLTKENRQVAKKRAEVGRKVRAEIKQIETSLIKQGVLGSNWCKEWNQ